jgi:hypothetical protein
LLAALERLPGEPRPQEAAALLMGLAQLQARHRKHAGPGAAAAAGAVGSSFGQEVPQGLLLRILQALACAEQQLEHRTIATAASALDMLPALQPPHSFWVAYFQATARVLPACTAASLSAIIKPVSAWQLQLPEGWLVAYCDAVQRRLADFKPRQLAGVVAALYALRQAVPLTWLDQLCSAEAGLSHGLVGRVIDSMDAFLAWRLEGGSSQEVEQHAPGAADASGAVVVSGARDCRLDEEDYDVYISTAHELLSQALG